MKRNETYTLQLARRLVRSERGFVSAAGLFLAVIVASFVMTYHFLSLSTGDGSQHPPSITALKARVVAVVAPHVPKSDYPNSPAGRGQAAAHVKVWRGIIWVELWLWNHSKKPNG
jgi:hypothetical protein